MIDETETPADFIAELGTALRARRDIDPELADILATYLLTATATAEVVTHARQAIEKLAAERAAEKMEAKSD